MDRIYELEHLLENCVNTLCETCGKYEFEYEGACDGCRWLAIRCGEYYDG